MNGIGPVNGAMRPLQNESQAELRKAVAEFEALFINQMLKTMRETVKKGDLFHGGNGEEIYTTLLDAELSKAMAQAGGIGLGDILLRDFTKDDPVPLDKKLPFGEKSVTLAPEVPAPFTAPKGRYKHGL